MTTPYGTAGFTGLMDDDALTGSPTAKALQVRETGTHQGVRDHLYLYLDAGDANKMPSAYSDWRPSTTNSTIFSFANTFDATNSSRLNTFYWNPVQYGRLPSGFVQGLTNGALAVSNLTSGNYLEARQRHWLMRTNDVSGPASVSHALSLERAPSPDGMTQGQISWYDYDNKYRGEPGNEGSSILPRFVAWKLPNGQSRFTKYVRNSLGHPTQLIETWQDSDGTVRVRTNTFTYAANEIDRLSVSNALGSLVSSNIYNANGLVTTNYNALLEATRYTFDSSNRLTSTRTPAGLTTTNVYGADGFLSKTIDLEIARTNSYTWSKALVYSHTDERGLTITNTWDNLNRLIKVTYPDGTFVTNVYANLDRVMTIDRMGFTNRWEYNDFRQVTRQVDALNRTNTFQYCECGSPEFAWDALNNRTDFYYDLAGRRVATAYADSYWVSNRFDLIGQVTNVLDSAGSSTTNCYNNQGLLVAVSNALGRVSARLYDSLDRATNSVDASGVTLALTYDAPGRVLTRTYSDNGVERFGYGAAGLLAYTNQLTNVTFYGYDAARRKTAETNANQEVTRFYYDASGNLTNLLDGKSQNTTWRYDLYGRVTNKLDHLGTSLFAYAYDLDNRLTNRTSAAKGGTGYRFDAAGNLTNVDYAVSPDLTLQYDGLNRLTNLVTAGTFTNRFGYTAAGLLASEGGPWDSDTVSFGYANRLRTTLTVESPTSAGWREAYGYDAAKRLTNVVSLAGSFGYEYSVGLQVGRLTLPGGAYITNTFDTLGRLLNTSLKNAQGALLNGHSHGYDVANQRTQQLFTAGNYVNYTYDPIGQLKTASGRESGGTTSRPHEKFGYAYDAAGNLAYRTNNALVQTFGVNSLNELTSVSRSGTLTVAGTTTSAATNVTVNAQAATLYSDATFAREGFSLSDGNNTFTAIAKDSYGRQDTNVVTAWLPASASYVYDLNGNLLSDGKRGFEYDDENQLLRVTVTNAWKSEFVYDGRMRRRVRKEYACQSGSYIQTNEVRYVYDGNLVVQERWYNPQVSISIPQQVISYTRGTDLSGSFEGAGGIGGLVARSSSVDLTYPHTYYHADGNGNVTALVSTNQRLVAKYLYDPYGNILSQSGPLAEENLYRFSSKELHPNSGLVYYLYRYYEPALQRWLNRDPIEEVGDKQLYRFCNNAGSGVMDGFGLFGRGQPPISRPPAPIHSPKGQESYCPPKPPCLGHNNLPGGSWDGEGGSFDYGGLDQPPTHPFPGGRPDLHFLPLSQAEADVRRAIDSGCDREAFQRAMHEGQDYFSHVQPAPNVRHPVLPFITYAGCNWNPGNFEFGHWLWLDAPDRNQDAWNQASEWTSRMLAEWRQRCPD